MNIEIQYKPAYAIARVSLNDGESIKAESGSMMSMTSNMSIQTNRAQKGIFKSLKLMALGGESFWMNTFTSKGNGEVLLAPTLPGDVILVNLQGTVFVQSSSYMGSHPGIELDTQFQGLKGFFSGESLFFIKCSGSGSLILSSYGGIEELDVDGEMIVDTGHIVAFQESLTYKIQRFGGWKSFFLGGEGLTMKFSGKGRIWVQSRNTASLGKWFHKVLPAKKQ
jgi:uncharacterized protein (TIGR00266 family)